MLFPLLLLGFDHKGKHFRVGLVTDLVQGGLEFTVEPDVWFWSILQAVGTQSSLRVLSELGVTVYIWLAWSPL